MKENLSQDPLYFRHLTPRGEGGISTFLVKNQKNQDFIDQHFKSFNDKTPTIKPGRFCYGKLFDQNHELIDEVILSILDENTLELHSHGGNISTREIIKFLESIHFKQMPETEFQQLDSLYHYHHALKNIGTIKEYEFIKHQLQNYKNLKKKFNELTDETLISLLKKMLEGWNKEKTNRRRANICLAGVPNAGKSSLINVITGKKRSLVSSLAKTTRDTVTENVQTRGYRINIIDTAGLHQPDNQLDEESIKQTILYINKSEIILWLHDSTLPFTAEETQHLKNIQSNNQAKPIWLVLTKSDKNSPANLSMEPTLFQNQWAISAQTGAGVEELIDGLILFLYPTTKEPLQIAAISEQMSIEITKFLQKVDLQPSKHKMLTEFFSKIINCIPNEMN